MSCYDMQYKKHWACLADFKKYIETTKAEQLVSFNGYELVTDQAKYGLAFGELSRTPHFPENTQE